MARTRGAAPDAGTRADPARRGTLAPPPRKAVYSNMAMTSFTSVGNSADSPEPPLRPLPATGHVAEILDICDLDLGYDAAKFPYQ